MVTMLDYIHEEKTALSAILEKNDLSLHVSYQNMQHVLILATGSSYNACLAAKPALESYGDITVDIQEPYHFNHYGKLSEEVDTVIAVSQSGKSASTVDAIQKIRSSKRRTIALTGDDQSPITKEVDQVIDLNMGVEKVGFVTKGYSATVLQHPSGDSGNRYSRTNCWDDCVDCFRLVTSAIFILWFFRKKEKRTTNNVRNIERIHSYIDFLRISLSDQCNFNEYVDCFW